jgi:hypothetical protein
MFCPKCGAEIKVEGTYCTACGNDLPSMMSPAKTEDTKARQSIICKFCRWFRNQTDPRADFCKNCSIGLLEEQIILKNLPVKPDPNLSKPDRIIKAKIATKQEEIKNISFIGPLIIGLLGIPALLFYIIPGLILFGFAFWWGSRRNNRKKKLSSEIKELEAELE